MDVNETPLPGVGLRYDFRTRSGRQIGVVSHRAGRRDLLIYDRKDPDTCQEVVQLNGEEAETLAEILGTARNTGRLAELQQRIEGLAIDWLLWQTLPDAWMLVGAAIIVASGVYLVRHEAVHAESEHP